MEITWLGHSTVKIEGPKTIYIDPFLAGNPLASIPSERIDKADLVIVTHYHGDHIGDAFEIAEIQEQPWLEFMR
ncbi:MAG: MBL fold metallo-hydrolase [Candidatus Aminicenantia bacterium]